jgi:hypothetical protein
MSARFLLLERMKSLSVASGLVSAKFAPGYRQGERIKIELNRQDAKDAKKSEPLPVELQQLMVHDRFKSDKALSVNRFIWRFSRPGRSISAWKL